jgi:hypothetical protein
MKGKSSDKAHSLREGAKRTINPTSCTRAGLLQFPPAGAEMIIRALFAATFLLASPTGHAREGTSRKSSMLGSTNRRWCSTEQARGPDGGLQAVAVPPRFDELRKGSLGAGSHARTLVPV